MNNSINKQLLNNFKIMSEEDPERLDFIRAFLIEVVNKRPIRVSMRLDNTNTVLVHMGEHMYKESFNTVEEANEFIESMKNLKKESA